MDESQDLETSTKSTKLPARSISRRDFLKLGANETMKAVAKVGAVALAIEVLTACDTPAKEEEIKQRTEALKSEISKTYNIDVDFSFNEYETFDVKATEISALDRYLTLEILKNEMAKYPPNIWKRSRITKIKPLADTTYAGVRVGGLQDHSQEDNKSVLYLDWGFNDNLESKANVFASEIHHETHHALRDAQPIEEAAQEVEKYAALNPNGKDAYTRERTADLLFQLGIQEVAGFASRYGLNNEKEDMATVGEQLMRHYDRIMERAKTDSVLMSKVAHVMIQYQRWSDGLMNVEWWNKNRNAHNV